MFAPQFREVRMNSCSNFFILVTPLLNGRVLIGPMNNVAIAMTSVTRLENYWSSAATEMVRRSRRHGDDDDDDAKQRCRCFRCCSPRSLTNAASNITLSCCRRKGTYSLCLLSERNIIRRFALSLVQWEYPFVCHRKITT